MLVYARKTPKLLNTITDKTYKSMTAKAALAKALLDGRVLNIKNCFEMVGITNFPREASRMIEKDFEVKLNRTPRTGKSRYGKPVTWFDYNLPRNEENKEGIQRMREYVAQQFNGANPKTDKQLKQQKLFA